MHPWCFLLPTFMVFGFPFLLMFSGCITTRGYTVCLFATMCGCFVGVTIEVILVDRHGLRVDFYVYSERLCALVSSSSLEPNFYRKLVTTLQCVVRCSSLGRFRCQLMCIDGSIFVSGVVPSRFLLSNSVSATLGNFMYLQSKFRFRNVL